MFCKTQEQIMRSWKKDEPCLISVVCATFNHELYIREAIESFLMQETDFPFEVIIHDDASTDKTASIIREFHGRYPSIIKPIIQKENQYSKGGFKPSIYAAGYSNGMYIALCEGDDYWISKHKLQIQAKAMLEHPEVDFSFHSAFRLRDGIRDKEPSWSYGTNKTLYPDYILNCVRTFAPTASYMFRRRVIDELPGWFYDTAPVGDFFLEMYGARRNGALYINIPMAVYRENSVDSWSARMSVESAFSLKHREKFLKTLVLMRDDFVEYSEKFDKPMAVTLGGISNCYLQLGSKELFKKYIKESVSHYAFYSPNQKLAYRLRCVPNILLWFIKVVGLLKRNKNIFRLRK